MVIYVPSCHVGATSPWDWPLLRSLWLLSPIFLLSQAIVWLLRNDHSIFLSEHQRNTLPKYLETVPKFPLPSCLSIFSSEYGIRFSLRTSNIRESLKHPPGSSIAGVTILLPLEFSITPRFAASLFLLRIKKAATIAIVTMTMRDATPSYVMGD